MVKTFCTTILIIAGLIFAGSMLAPSQADAQKKPKSKPAVQQPKTQEGDEEQAAPEHPAPVIQPATSVSGGVLDIMKKFLGQKTNLGTLKKVNKDYVEFEDENVILTVPVPNVHSVKQVTEKDDNDSTVVRLEVRLIAKD